MDRLVPRAAWRRIPAHWRSASKGRHAMAGRSRRSLIVGFFVHARRRSRSPGQTPAPRSATRKPARSMTRDSATCVAVAVNSARVTRHGRSAPQAVWRRPDGCRPTQGWASIVPYISPPRQPRQRSSTSVIGTSPSAAPSRSVPGPTDAGPCHSSCACAFSMNASSTPFLWHLAQKALSGMTSPAASAFTGSFMTALDLYSLPGP